MQHGKRPAFQFYPADWLTDLALRSCSVAARGLWIDMICLMHDGRPYGHLTVGKKILLEADIARIAGVSAEAVVPLLAELEGAEVFSRKPSGVIFSRRMVRDEAIRERRANGGKLGGNPALVNLPLEGKVNPRPTPSSSSSSSSSSVPNGTAKGEQREQAGNGFSAPSSKAVDVIFGAGLRMLTGASVPEAQARTFLGRLRKEVGDDARVAAAILRAEQVAPSDPRSWLRKAVSLEPSRNGRYPKHYRTRDGRTLVVEKTTRVQWWEPGQGRKSFQTADGLVHLVRGDVEEVSA